MTRLLIDASSIIRASHYAGKDVEHGYTVQFEGRPVYINSAQWAYDSFMLSLRLILEKTGIAPYQVVLVLDGKGSRFLRAAIFPEYKAHRKPTPPELNKEYFDALEGIKDEIMALGGIVCFQDGYEADDVLAYLALNLKGRKIIWTRDKDMLALVGEQVNVLIGDEIDPWIHNACPPEFVWVYKALCGDASDGFKGAAGFGEKAFEGLITKFGLEGLTLMRELIEQRRLHELAEDVDEFKPLQKIMDSAKEVYVSYALAKLYPEHIDDLQIEMRAGQVTHPEMAKWYQTKKLAVPADAGWIVKEIAKSPFVSLDLETWTPKESDVWVSRIAEAGKGKKKTLVDVFGSKIAGMALTFGENLQHTAYMPINHKDCPLWTEEQVMDLVAAIPEGTRVLAHNASGFELPVIYKEWGVWVDGVWCTADMASYVNENLPMNLKFLSEHYLGYKQATYEEVTQGRKMNELTGLEVRDYACDDTIVTAALYNRLLFTLELEDTLAAFELLEPEANYWVAETFVRGQEIDWERLKELKVADSEGYESAWAKLKEYLRSKGWPGCTYTPWDGSVTGIRVGFKTVYGVPLASRVRKLEKLVEAIRDQGGNELADAIENDSVDDLLQEYHTGEPEFDSDKTAHIVSLLYDVMGLPVRFRNPPTKVMRAKGQRTGSIRADYIAVQHALQLDVKEGTPEHEALLALREMKAVKTRLQMYYKTYPLHKHWSDGRIHAQLGKNRTVTRRFAPSNVNLNQVPKRKDGGKIRSLFKAPPGYLWVSADWSGQELRLTAEVSGDVALTSCYVGDNKKNAHSLTAAGIASKRGMSFADYESFVLAKQAGDPQAIAIYDKAKSVNFGTTYGCMAPKLAEMLVIELAEAQEYLDTKNSVFRGVACWQETSRKDAHRFGYSKTLLGARRHLKSTLNSSDKWEVLAAERQAGNASIQGSGAEMCKSSINAMHKDGRLSAFGAYLTFPVHDEGNFLVRIDNAWPAIELIHMCMVQPYADMKIPIESELSIGPSFGELFKVGTNPTEESVNAVITKIMERSHADGSHKA